MEKLNQEFTYIISALSTKTGRIVLLALTLALFILSAAAPNATIGIGK